MSFHDHVGNPRGSNPEAHLLPPGVPAGDVHRVVATFCDHCGAPLPSVLEPTIDGRCYTYGPPSHCPNCGRRTPF